MKIDIEQMLYDKYDRGSKEHRQAWEEVDARSEMIGELLDLMWYSSHPSLERWDIFIWAMHKVYELAS